MWLLVLFVLFAVCMVVAVIAGVITGFRQNTEGSKYFAKATSSKRNSFNHPTKATSKPIPPNPRYYNIGSKTFHTSKECMDFSLLEPWDAVTELEALTMGLTCCQRCVLPIVFVYPRGTVYHKTRFCSDSRSLPSQMSEREAIALGMHRCMKCW